MNKFQKEIQRRKRKFLNFVGMGTVPYRIFIGFIRKKLKEDIKLGKVKF
jgi:hypothetical protein